MQIFKILLDASTSWSHVCFLYQLATWIQFEHHFHIIELRQVILTMLVNLYLKLLVITAVAHVHTQNGLAE